MAVYSESLDCSRRVPTTWVVILSKALAARGCKFKNSSAFRRFVGKYCGCVLISSPYAFIVPLHRQFPILNAGRHSCAAYFFLLFFFAGVAFFFGTGFLAAGFAGAFAGVDFNGAAFFVGAGGAGAAFCLLADAACFAGAAGAALTAPATGVAASGAPSPATAFLGLRPRFLGA